VSGLVYVSSMARAGALPEAGIGIRTSCPQKILERIPAQAPSEAVRALLLETLKAKKQSEHVYVDADLVPRTAARSGRRRRLRRAAQVASLEPRSRVGTAAACMKSVLP
jgi:hypothetical protein